MSSTIKKVCVIGAGPNGLMAARHLSECQNTQVTIFEANSEVGGLWVYDEKNEADKKFEPEKRVDNYYKLNNYFHASLYPYLQSNLPYFFMGFKDLSHADLVKDISVFIDISQHKDYLEAYAQKFDLKRKTVFNTLVKSVRLYDNLSPEMQAEVPEKRKFAVTTVRSRGEDLNTNAEVHAFDYVVVCTGHNSKPHVPVIKGIENFKGKVMTAKSFREPSADHFIDKRILVLGASYSAIDMVVQLFDNPYVGPQNLKQMTLVGRGVKGMKSSDDFDKYRKSGKLNVIEGEVQEIVGDHTVRLSDGSEYEIDTFVFCTGYELNFPFLDFETDKMIDFNRNAFNGKFIAPIYKRFVSIREPNLFFIGFLDYSAIGSFCDEAQAILAKAIVDGKYKLPSQNEMIQSFLKDIDDMQWNFGKSMACFFRMFPLKLDITYLEDLKGLLRQIYPHDIEKAKEFNEALMSTYKKILEFFSSGDVLSYKNFDFHKTFDRTIRNSSSFM